MAIPGCLVVGLGEGMGSPGPGLALVEGAEHPNPDPRNSGYKLCLAGGCQSRGTFSQAGWGLLIQPSAGAFGGQALPKPR